MLYCFLTWIKGELLFGFMRDLRLKIVNTLIAITSIFILSQSIFGQAACLTNDEVKKMVAQADWQPAAQPDLKLRDELLQLKADNQRLFQRTTEQGYNDDELMKRLHEAREENSAHLCQILKEHGWPTMSMVGKDGVAAAFYLLKNSEAFELQRELLPVIIAAVKRDEIEKSDFAGLVDRLRLRAGQKQIFGTQASVINGFLILHPIEDEAHVDARRNQYGLPPLAEYLKALQRIYGLPLVKSPSPPTRVSTDRLQSSIQKTIADNLPDAEPISEGDVVRVDTNLVSLNVSVYSNKFKAYVGALEQKDFAVFEDGHEETITHFATTDEPFDLVLLLDLSGSTSNKRDLIRKTTQRFIEAARPYDRLAIITFSSDINVISPLTTDRAKLLESTKKIKSGGGSRVWDALKFTLDEVLGTKKSERRRAVVFMTDGVDNALMPFGGGSEISFADLVEAVRQTDALIIPIYLDTEFDHSSGSSPGAKRLYENARNTLALLADESGGIYYKARKVEDLNGVYDQVINDLGKVYSLGYKPTDEKRDGSWRTVKIQILNRPDLTARTRPGYYSN
ncbi:MAG TPA: VWA domain-containing protein [Pyrinomonadaceae bacterium]|nr:VWA domain-containing protein [Pyrinomonadaceae bacterium]